MSAPESRRGRDLTGPSRITPRNSTAAPGNEVQESPYEILRQLSRVIAQPGTPRRASSAGPTVTPTTQIRTPGLAALRPGSIRRPNPATPHARAALREIELRRAAVLTPGGDRRRSLRQQRDSPRDALRALSKILATETEPTKSSSPYVEDERTQRLNALRLDEEADNEPEPIRPRLSIPLNQLEEDDSLVLDLPQSVALDDDNLTVQSVELPRRAASEQLPGRFSRGSFGSVRQSDRFADLRELGFEDVDEYMDDTTVQTGFGDVNGIDDQDNTTIRPVLTDDGTGRLSLASGRESDIRPQGILQDEENTFVFTVPQRAQATRARVSTIDPTLGDITKVTIPTPTRTQQVDQNDADVNFGGDDDDDGPNMFETGGLMDDEAEEGEEDEDEEMDGEVGDEGIERLYDPTITLRTSSGDVTRDITMQQSHPLSAARAPALKALEAARKKKKEVRVNKHGVRCPSLPQGVIKRLATNFARTSGSSKTVITKETLAAIMQASDWFFEQASEDLSAYAEHAGRKTIDETDVVTLMRRQRLINSTTTPFSLAQKYLPRELLQELRMQVPPQIKKGRIVDEEDEEEDYE